MFTGCEEFINWLENPVSPRLRMSDSPKTMKVGDTYTREAFASSGAVVVYSSSNEAVATVDEKGTVTAVAEGTATITASVTDGKVQYTQISYLKESVSYEVTVVPAIDPLLATPLTLEVTSVAAGTTIVIKSPKVGMKYKKNNEALVTINSTEDVTINVAIGDKVAFYGNGTSITSYNGTNIKDGTAKVKVYGNIMSLVDEEGFANNKTLTGDYAFNMLFFGNDQLTNASDLKLPATTLTKNCYANMFNGCTNLTTPPELPAKTLALGCYYSMFQSCSSLTTAPELPAETLASDCYWLMFCGCSSLTTAPELPAKTLTSSCYRLMFQGCTSLTTAPELPAKTLAPTCYCFMFQYCTGLTTAPELPATELKNYCYQNMFRDCTSLTTAPKLPATELKNHCYESMFQNCTSLTKAYVKAAYTTTNAECTDMFIGCTATGAILHTTSANQASWGTVMPTTWATWTADADWTD